MTEKPDIYGNTPADYARAHAAMDKARERMRPADPLQRSPYLDRPIRTEAQARDDIAARHPGLVAAVQRVAERDSADLEEREESLHAAVILARLNGKGET